MSGQAMVESVIVIMVICLFAFAMFQYANLLSAKQVLTHAAARAARARTVGLNHWMVEKSAKVAAIPVSGRRISEVTEWSEDGSGFGTGAETIVSRRSPWRMWSAALRARPHSLRAQLERARIPDYMDSINSPTSGEVLDYELWEHLHVGLEENTGWGGKLTVTVSQRQPLLISYLALTQGELRNLREDDVGFVRLRGEYSIENHYPLYMEDNNW